MLAKALGSAAATEVRSSEEGATPRDEGEEEREVSARRLRTPLLGA